MRISRLISVMAALACLVPAASSAQGLGFGFGFGGTREIVRIGPSARARLRDYLAAEYKHECPEHKKKLPEECALTKPLYVSSAISARDSEPLPPDVIRTLGFVEPGTAYVQQGFVVYLIRLPRRIILDTVSVDEK